MLNSLSGRFLSLTAAFVVLAEVLIFRGVPWRSMAVRATAGPSGVPFATSR